MWERLRRQRPEPAVREVVLKVKWIWDHRGDAGCGGAAPKTCPAQGRSECLEFTFDPNVSTLGVSWFPVY